MSIAGMEKVREAEASAEQLRRSAEDDVNRITAEGRKEAKALLDEAEKQAQSEYKAVMAKAEDEASRLYQEKIDAEQAACEQVKTAAREHLPAAVDLIVGKVVGTYGNS